MRRSILTLSLLLISAPALSATETRPAEVAVPEVRLSVVEKVAPEAAALKLTQVQVEQRAASDAAPAAQLGPRGGFWWLVGVIVVAAVILTVLL